MKMSVRELRAQVAAAIAAAERGEDVIITRNGTPVARVAPLADPAAPPSDAEPTDAQVDEYWARLMAVRRKLGLNKYDDDPPLDEEWREEFDDPAFGRAALGLDDDWRPRPGGRL